jgi:hypothetical protein
VIVVSDTSVILNLCFLEQEALLPLLFGTVHAPPQVEKRCQASSLVLGSWFLVLGSWFLAKESNLSASIFLPKKASRSSTCEGRWQSRRGKNAPVTGAGRSLFLEEENRLENL